MSFFFTDEITDIIYTKEEMDKFRKIYGSIDETRDKLNSYTRLILGTPENRDVNLMKKVFEINHNKKYTSL